MAMKASTNIRTEMNGVDIMDIEIIDYLKGELAKF